MRTTFITSIFALLAAAHTTFAASCADPQPLHLCCRAVAEWKTNSAVWGGICGVTPADPDTLMGGGCEEAASW